MRWRDNWVKGELWSTRYHHRVRSRGVFALRVVRDIAPLRRNDEPERMGNWKALSRKAATMELQSRRGGGGGRLHSFDSRSRYLSTLFGEWKFRSYTISRWPLPCRCIHRDRRRKTRIRVQKRATSVKSTRAHVRVRLNVFLISSWAVSRPVRIFFRNHRRIIAIFIKNKSRFISPPIIIRLT